MPLQRALCVLHAPVCRCGSRLDVVFVGIPALRGLQAGPAIHVPAYKLREGDAASRDVSGVTTSVTRLRDFGKKGEQRKDEVPVMVQLNPLTFIVESLGGATLLERLQVCCAAVPAASTSGVSVCVT